MNEPEHRGRWVVEWRDRSNATERNNREIVDSPDQAVAVIDRLLTGRAVTDDVGPEGDYAPGTERSAFAAMFPGLDPVVILRQLRPGGVLEQETADGILTVTREPGGLPDAAVLPPDEGAR